MTKPDDGRPAGDSVDLTELLLPQRARGIRRLPPLVLAAVRLAWQAAPRQLLVAVGLQLLGGLGVAGQVLVGRQVLQGVLGAENSSTGLRAALLPLVAFALVTTVVAFANLARVEQQRLLGELVGRRSVDQVLEVATAVDLLTFDAPGFHNRLQRALVNATVRPVQMVTGVLGTFSALVTIAGLVTALVIIEPIFVAVLLVGYLPLWVLTKRASRVAYDFTLKQTERDRLRGYLASILTSKSDAAEVRAFALSTFFRERHGALWDQRIVETRELVSRRLKLGFLGTLVTTVLSVASIALLVALVADGRLPLASAGAAAGALILLGQRLSLLASSAGALYESSLFIEDFTSFVSVMPALERAQGGESPPAGFDVLEARGLGFTYPSRSEPALTDVSLTLRRGQVVALVGENGSGKTTLAKLLAGLYTPATGAVTWDGVDLAGCDPRQVREHVGVIFQDFVRYMMTAGENITVGRISASDDHDRRQAAALKASADAFLSGLREGYDSRLGPEFHGGSDLSGGQWQRVALARAFFRDAPFLILDEPTAALDPRSEAELFESIRSLYSGRTVLLVSHRFSSVRSADLICVLKEGRLVENGTHEELMRLDGLYAELFTLQASAYQDSPSEASPA